MSRLCSVKKGCADLDLRKGNPEDLLTVPEIAQWARVDDTTVRRWIKNGALEAITLPHRGTRQAYRIRRGALARAFPTTAQ